MNFLSDEIVKYEMREMLHRIMRSKFIFIGLFIGLTSAMGVKMVMNTSGPRVPVWVFFVPPILAFAVFKFGKKK